MCDPLVRRPQPVADDALHRIVDIEIVEAVGEPRVQRCGRDRRDAAAGRRDSAAARYSMMMLDLGDRAVARIESRSTGILPTGHSARKAAAEFRIAEIHDLPLERRAVLVQRDQHLLTVGRKRVEMERERHGRPLLPPSLDCPARPSGRRQVAGQSLQSLRRRMVADLTGHARCPRGTVRRRPGSRRRVGAGACRHCRSSCACRRGARRRSAGIRACTSPGADRRRRRRRPAATRRASSALLMVKENGFVRYSLSVPTTRSALRPAATASADGPCDTTIRRVLLACASVGDRAASMTVGRHREDLDRDLEPRAALLLVADRLPHAARRRSWLASDSSR